MTKDRPDAGISAAIRLLTDAGYVVLKAPNWPAGLEISVERASGMERQLATGEKARVHSSSRGDMMTIKEFCTQYSISRSTAYVEMKAGRLKMQKIGRSTRISESAAAAWLKAWNPD